MADNITTFNIVYNPAQAEQQTQALIQQLESKYKLTLNVDLKTSELQSSIKSSVEAASKQASTSANVGERRKSTVSCLLHWICPPQYGGNAERAGRENGSARQGTVKKTTEMVCVRSTWHLDNGCPGNSRMSWLLTCGGDITGAMGNAKGIVKRSGTETIRT